MDNVHIEHGVEMRIFSFSGNSDIQTVGANKVCFSANLTPGW